MEDGRELYDAARSAFGEGQFERAVELFERSAKITPHFKTFELLGESLLALGRSAEAVMPLAAAATLNQQGRASALLAKAFLELAQNDEAIAAAEESLRRSPGNAVALDVLRVIRLRA